MNKVQKKELEILKEFDRICQKYEINYSLGYGTLLGAIRHKGFIPWDDDVDVIMLRKDYDKFVSLVNLDLDRSKFSFINNSVESKFYYGFSKIRSKELIMPEQSTEYLGIQQGVWIDIFPFDAIPDDGTLALDQKKRVKKYHNFFVATVFTYPSETDRAQIRFIKSLLRGFNDLTQNFKRIRQNVHLKLEKEMLRYNHTDTKRFNALGCNLTDIEYTGGMLRKDDFESFIYVPFEDYSFPIIKRHHEHLQGIYGDYMTLPTESKQISNHAVSIATEVEKNESND